MSLSALFSSERWVIPDLLIGFTADLEHLFALELQLFSQSADILVECVDLAVQLSDVVLPPGYLLLQLIDATQQLTLLERGLKIKKDLIYLSGYQPAADQLASADSHSARELAQFTKSANDSM